MLLESQHHDNKGRFLVAWMSQFSFYFFYLGEGFLRNTIQTNFTIVNKGGINISTDINVYGILLNCYWC